jgi:hypothetical protein
LYMDIHWHAHTLTPKIPMNVPHSRWQGHFRHLNNSCTNVALPQVVKVLSFSAWDVTLVCIALRLLKPWWSLISFKENCAKPNFNSGMVQVIDKVEGRFSRTNTFYAELGCLMRMHFMLQTLSTREWPWYLASCHQHALYVVLRCSKE